MKQSSELSYLHLLTYISEVDGRAYQYENANIVLANSFTSGRKMLSEYYLMAPQDGYIPESIGVFVLDNHTLETVFHEMKSYMVNESFYYFKPLYTALTENENIHEQSDKFDESISLILAGKETIEKQNSIASRALDQLSGIDDKLLDLDDEIREMYINIDLLSETETKTASKYKNILEAKIATRSAIRKCATSYRSVIQSSNENVAQLKESLKTTLNL